VNELESLIILPL